MVRTTIVVAAAVLLGCGGSGAPPTTIVPPADIAGTYTFVGSGNRDEVTMTNCSGSLAHYEGTALADLPAGGCTSEPLPITQDEYTWAAYSSTTCPGSGTSDVTASGTVFGTRIDGRIRLDDPSGTATTTTIENGTANGDGTILFRYSGFNVTGPARGACSLIPPQEVLFSTTRSRLSADPGAWSCSAQPNAMVCRPAAVR